MTAKSASKGIIKDIIIVAVGVLVIWIALQIVFGTQNPFYVVSSGSMIPELQVYDVLVVQGNTPFSEIEIGDVIVFNRPSDHDRVIVHRVVSIIEEDPLTIRTKGDANPASIPGTDFPITEDDYIGEVAYVVPQVGYITRVLTPPINYIIIAIIIGVMIFKQVSKKKEKKEISEPFESAKDQLDGEQDSQNQIENLNETPKDDIYTDSKNVEPQNPTTDSKDESEFKKDPENSTKPS